MASHGGKERISVATVNWQACSSRYVGLSKGDPPDGSEAVHSPITPFGD
jgi:hypothetical protein